jgi:hypothetical protein
MSSKIILVDEEFLMRTIGTAFIVRFLTFDGNL